MQVAVDARLARHQDAPGLLAECRAQPNFFLTHFTRLSVPVALLDLFFRQDLAAPLTARFGPPDAETTAGKVFFFTYEGGVICATCSPGRTDWRWRDLAAKEGVLRPRSFASPYVLPLWPRMCVDLCRALGHPVPDFSSQFPAKPMHQIQSWITTTEEEVLRELVPAASPLAAPVRL